MPGKHKNNGKTVGIVVGFITLFVAGVLAGYFWPRGCSDTSLSLQVDDDFGIITGGALNSTWNCSYIEIEYIGLDGKTVRALNAFFADNESATIGFGNFTSCTGVTEPSSNYGEAYWGASYTNPTVTDSLDGKSFKFTFGDWYVLPSIYIETFNGTNAVHHDYIPIEDVYFMFMFALGGLNMTTWESTVLLHGCNSLTITSWTYDSANVSDSTLQIVLNGVADDWVYVPLSP